MTQGLHFVEKIGYGFLFATSLTVALAWSPLWRHLPDITLLFPPRHAALLDALPGAPNTGLAFLVTLAVSYAALLLMRDATFVLGALAASVLGTAAYPYGNIKWHLLFASTPFDQGSPTVGAWLRGLVVIALLLVPPILTHTRALLAAYQRKGIAPAERRIVQRHLLRGAGIASGTALLVSILLGLGITYGGRILASESRVLGRNSAVVMLIVAVLLVFALGVGTGLFGREAKVPDRPEEGPEKEAVPMP